MSRGSSDTLLAHPHHIVYGEGDRAHREDGMPEP